MTSPITWLNKMGGRPSTKDTKETHTDEAENDRIIVEYLANYSIRYVPFRNSEVNNLPGPDHQTYR